MTRPASWVPSRPLDRARLELRARDAFGAEAFSRPLSDLSRGCVAAVAPHVVLEGLVVEADDEELSGHGLPLAVGGGLAELGGELLGREHPSSDPLKDLLLRRPGVGLEQKTSVRQTLHCVGAGELGVVEGDRPHGSNCRTRVVHQNGTHVALGRLRELTARRGASRLRRLLSGQTQLIEAPAELDEAGPARLEAPQCGGQVVDGGPPLAATAVLEPPSSCCNHAEATAHSSDSADAKP